MSVSANVVPVTLICVSSFGLRLVKFLRTAYNAVFNLCHAAIGSAETHLAMVAVLNDMPPPFEV